MNELEKIRKIGKKELAYVRMVAITLSCLVATMTFLNLITVTMHGIEFEIPDEESFNWAIDPVGQKLLFMSNFSVSNKGAYDIDNLGVRAWLENSQGVRLIEFNKEDLAIIRGGERTFDIIVELPVDTFGLAGWFEFLTMDDTVSLYVDIDADYMLGLVHMTVDEVIEYPWSAPLKDAVDEDNIMSNLGVLLDIAESGVDQGIDSLEPVFMDMLGYSDEIELGFGNGTEFILDVLNIDNSSLEIACFLSGPIGETGDIGLSFILGIELYDAMISVDLKEVNFHYVA